MMCAGKNGKNWTAPASKTLMTKWAFGEHFDIHRAYNVSFPSDYIWYLNTTDYEIFTKNHQLNQRTTEMSKKWLYRFQEGCCEISVTSNT